MKAISKPILLLSALSFAVYAMPVLFSTKFIVTDEVGLDYFSSLLADHGDLSYVPRGDQIFGFPGFIPGQTVYSASGEAVPKQPPGFILLAALVKAITPGKVFLLINPILGVLCVLLLYAIGREFLSGEQGPLYAALILASTPVFIHWSQMLFVDMANLTAFLLAFWCLVRAFETRRMRHLAGCGLSLGAMIWIRQSSVLLLLPFAVYLFLNRERVTAKSCLLPAGCFALAILLLMLYNTWIYGSPVQTGYTLHKIPRAQGSISSDLAGVMRFATESGELFWLRVKWIIPALHLAFPPLLIAFIGLISGLGAPPRRNLALFITLLLIVLFAFFADRPTYGSGRAELTLQSSLLRYLLPFLALCPVPVIWALEKLNIERLRWVSLLVLLNLGVAAFAHFGIIHTLLNRLYMEDVAQFITGNTTEKTVIVSPYWNHIAYRERMVHTRNFPTPEYLMSTTHGILRGGYDVALIYHKSDELMFETLDERIDFETVKGPEKLHSLLQLLPMPIPGHVYPVTLYRISPAAQSTTTKE